MRKTRVLTVLMVVGLLAGGSSMAAAAADCVSCHQRNNPGMYLQWKNSAHGENDVGCIDCHGAEEDDVDAFSHFGATVATLVTPKDCGQCHPEIEQETTQSYHAHAGEILKSNDAYLAHAAGGHPVAIVGCESCHGANVKIDPDAKNKLSSETWPNSGVGRLNPDGSKGACNACHVRHSFSKYQARQPGNCGKCHLGPDHPQKEIYDESKHGVAYNAFREDLNLRNDEWVVGVDYYEAPTCTTCHMSATPDQVLTHDVGDRISWTLRPAVSTHKDNWQEKREAMKDVCSNCHQASFVDGHYYQYDAMVHLYNEKFAKPAGKIYTMAKDKGLLEREAAFSNELDWQYWELWHHEGRRARMGAAMMGPDYAWWHGIYDVAHNFYFEFIPEAQHLGDDEINAYIDKLLTEDPMHKWINSSTADIKKAISSGELQKVYSKFFEKE